MCVEYKKQPTNLRGFFIFDTGFAGMSRLRSEIGRFRLPDLEAYWFFPLELRTTPFWGDVIPGVRIHTIALEAAARELRFGVVEQCIFD